MAFIVLSSLPYEASTAPRLDVWCEHFQAQDAWAAGRTALE